MENQASGGLEIVLRLVEEGRVNPIEFGAERQSRVRAVVQTDATLRGQRGAATRRSLRLQVPAADQPVCPRLKPVAAPTDAKASATLKVFYVIVALHRRCEAGAPACQGSGRRSIPARTP